VDWIGGISGAAENRDIWREVQMGMGMQCGVIAESVIVEIMAAYHRLFKEVRGR